MIVIATRKFHSRRRLAKKEADERVERSLYRGNRGQGFFPPNPHHPVRDPVATWGATRTMVAPTQYKAKSITALQLALGSLPDRMRVEVETDIGVSAKIVGELHKVTAWPENLAITTPQHPNADSFLRPTYANPPLFGDARRACDSCLPPK
jgi:hypothetical protein